MVGSTGISFSGLASGLDTQAIVQQLVAIERLPIQTLQGRRSLEQRKLDLIGQLGDLVKKLQDKAENLETPDAFKSNSATISDETFATVSATEEAIAGSHTIEVQQLAATDRWAFDAVSSSTDNLTETAGQQISFTVGTTNYSLTVDESNSSLEGIASQLNDLAPDDISASVVNTGTTANPSYQLVLSSRTTGEDGRITNLFSDVSGPSESLNVDYVAPDSEGVAQSDNNITVGNDAIALIDGLLVRREDNDFGGVIEGVSIQVSRETSTGETLELTIEPDRDAVKGKVREFIDSYNDVMSFITTQNTFTPSEDEGDNGGTTGLLFGDNVLNGVRSALNRSLFDVDLGTVLADTEGYSTLRNVGIEQGSDGQLSLDEAVFDDKFTENLEALADLFGDSDGFDNGGAEPGDPNYYVDTTDDSGLMASLVREIDRMFGRLPTGNNEVTIRGLFDAKKDSLKSQIKSYNQDIQRKEDRLARFEESLILQYARFEELMSGLQSQGASLTNALG